MSGQSSGRMELPSPGMRGRGAAARGRRELRWVPGAAWWSVRVGSGHGHQEFGRGLSWEKLGSHHPSC